MMRYNLCNMNTNNFSTKHFVMLTVIALLTGCATGVKTESAVVSDKPVAVAPALVEHGIESAQRALPTVVTNVKQVAHYDHVYIDSSDVNARSLKTITLEDAVAHDVLASSPLPVVRQEIDASKLEWVTFDSGFERPTSIEGVGGFGVEDGNFVEVNFDVDKTEILNKEKISPLIDKAARVSGIFYVVGYADETGIESKNKALSLNRAISVKEMLVQANIHPTRVIGTGAGVSRTYPELSSNRRASIVFKVSN